MLSGFKQFILRGNVVDMAVGVVIGAAFGGMVTALTKDLLTPLIAAIVGKPDFSYLGFSIRGTLFPVGDFINACLSFLLIAAAIYFFVVTPVNALAGLAGCGGRSAAEESGARVSAKGTRQSHPGNGRAESQDQHGRRRR